MKRCVNLIRASGATMAARNATNKVGTHTRTATAVAPLPLPVAVGSVRHAAHHPSLVCFPVIAHVCPQSSVRTFAAFADFNWKDPLNLDSKLTDEERMVRDTAHTYAQSKLLPRITQANRSDERATHQRMHAYACRTAVRLRLCACVRLRLLLMRVRSAS